MRPGRHALASTPMAQFIHLLDSNDASRIRRGGIRVVKSKSRKVNGVFLFPLTENFVISHQWMRELRRLRGQTLLAARIRLDDEEPVLLGKFNEPHMPLTAAEAIGIVREHNDPLGLEVILPRSVKAKEIESFYRPPKVIGWRYYPNARGRPPCGCSYCQKGEPFGKRIRTLLRTSLS
jgi:hypothetical protein